MADRPFLYSVDSGPGRDPPSILFQQLCGDYPDFPRRVVGDVLGQVYGASWASAPEPLSPAQLGTAARALLETMRHTEPGERLPFLEDRTEIHQATGMVSVQLGVSLSVALSRLHARALAEDQPVSTLAHAVVARTVRFGP